MRARDIGMDVVYEGIRLTPAQIARCAVDEGVHVIGLSILSGSHRSLIPDVIDGAARGGRRGDPRRGRRDHPRGRRRAARRPRASPPSTRPKDFELTRIMRDVVGLVAERNGVSAAA